MDAKTIEYYIGPLALVWKYKLFTIAGVDLSLGNILLALTFLLFATRIARFISLQIEKRLIKNFVPDRSSQHTYKTFSFYASLASVVALSLTIAGIPLTIFTVVGGALAIGVGFGSQNVVSNFISGIIMLVEQPIKVGDVVEVDGVIGTVQSIGTRSTKIKNPDNKIFIVPNSFFLEKSVMNWSFGDTIVRATVNFGVAYGSDTRLVENVCMDLMLNNPLILQDPMPQVIFEDFADSTLVFQLIFFCNLESASILRLRSDVRFKIDERFKEMKIEMAFPQRDMNLKLNKALEVKVLS